MDSFNQRHQAGGFRFRPNSTTMNHDENDAEFSGGVLEIYVHHARNIHNICIYENQDVYAKFSLTYNPDETLSTRIILGGGKNPTFNEKLKMKITQIDAVLKCEIWMLSRARNYMEDQLLGFTLVPISQLVGKEKVTQDYSLSSTDLLHSPAGTVKLSLTLDTNFQVGYLPLNSLSDSAVKSSISSEVVLLRRKISEVALDPIEYSRIEFPDINLVRENQQMITEYFNSTLSHGSAPRTYNSGGLLPFLCLGTSPQLADDCEMTANSCENQCGTFSPKESIHHSGLLSPCTTSIRDDRNSSDSIEKRSHLRGTSSNSVDILISTSDGNQNTNPSPETPTSKKENEIRGDTESNLAKKEEEKLRDKNSDAAKFGQVFIAPLGNINLEAEQSAMQQQIVGMYMRSMQQFTESLEKMNLPMDLHKNEREDSTGHVAQNHNDSNLEVDKKKDGSRDSMVAGLSSNSLSILQV